MKNRISKIKKGYQAILDEGVDRQTQVVETFLASVSKCYQADLTLRMFDVIEKMEAEKISDNGQDKI